MSHDPSEIFQKYVDFVLKKHLLSLSMLKTVAAETCISAE